MEREGKPYRRNYTIDPLGIHQSLACGQDFKQDATELITELIIETINQTVPLEKATHESFTSVTWTTVLIAVIAISNHVIQFDTSGNAG